MIKQGLWRGASVCPCIINVLHNNLLMAAVCQTSRQCACNYIFSLVFRNTTCYFNSFSLQVKNLQCWLIVISCCCKNTCLFSHSTQVSSAWNFFSASTPVEWSVSFHWVSLLSHQNSHPAFHKPSGPCVAMTKTFRSAVMYRLREEKKRWLVQAYGRVKRLYEFLLAGVILVWILWHRNATMSSHV